MNQERVTTFSLLAYINNNTDNTNSPVGDLLDVFVPLVKRVLHRLNEQGLTKNENLDCVEKMFQKEYKFDIPLSVLKKILSKIDFEYKELNTPPFTLHRDYSFQIKNFFFADYEEVINNQEEEIKKVDATYKKYLEIRGIDALSQPSIFDFIDKNRISLSTVFANNSRNNLTNNGSVQAEFIDTIKSSKENYDVLKRVYLGSIISAYLEYKTEHTINDVELVFDTNFILSLLDFNSPESTRICLKLIEISKKIGYKLTVLDYTIEEIRGKLDRTAQDFDRFFLRGRIDPEDIYNACERRSVSKTDLQRTSKNLENILCDDFNIITLPNTEKYRNIARNSPEYENFKKIRNNNHWSALHDATAIIYVRHKRNNKKLKEFADVTAWFVNNSNKEYSKENNSYIDEFIRAEDLVNILWLSNPRIQKLTDGDNLANLGLTKLIASTINASLPNSSMIKELDQNIQRYAKDKISDSDIISFGKRIASKSYNRKIEELNKIAENNPDTFVMRLKEETKLQREQEDRLRSMFSSLSDKVSQMDNQMTEKIKDSESEIQRLTEESIVKELKIKQESYNSSKKLLYEKLRFKVSIINNLKNSIKYKIKLFITFKNKEEKSNQMVEHELIKCGFIESEINSLCDEIKILEKELLGTLFLDLNKEDKLDEKKIEQNYTKEKMNTKNYIPALFIIGFLLLVTILFTNRVIRIKKDEVTIESSPVSSDSVVVQKKENNASSTLSQFSITGIVYINGRVIKQSEVLKLRLGHDSGKEDFNISDGVFHFKKVKFPSDGILDIFVEFKNGKLGRIFKKISANDIVDNLLEMGPLDVSYEDDKSPSKKQQEIKSTTTTTPTINQYIMQQQSNGNGGNTQNIK